MECHHRRLRFWSSVAFGPSVKGLIKHLNRNGFDACARFHISDEAYRSARGLLPRILLRLRMYVFYPLLLVIGILFEKRPTLHIVCTNPFYAPFLAALASRLQIWITGRRSTHRTPVIHWVYDLFPEALVQSGKIHPEARLIRLMAWITRQTFHLCAANVFLGQRLLATTQQIYGPIPNAHVIPIGADSAPFSPKPPSQKATTYSAGTLTLLYCGNMGRLHDIDTLAGSLIQGPHNGFGPQRLNFQFYANGAHYQKLRGKFDKTPLPKGITLEFHSSLATRNWVSVMSRADIALVTMSKGAQKVIMPSKTYSALAAGQAILAICPQDSDLADLVKRHDCGWIVTPENFRSSEANDNTSGIKKLQTLLKQLAHEPEAIFLKRKHAYYASHHYYDAPVLAKQWAALIHKIATRGQENDVPPPKPDGNGCLESESSDSNRGKAHLLSKFNGEAE